MAAVLIIDDSEECSQMLRSYLEKDRYTVFVAPDVISGLALAKKIQPVLIMLDIEMPDINGLEAIELFKQHASLGQIPIIMITGKDNAEADSVIHALDRGAHDYVTKGTKYPIISARIRSAINLTQYQQDLLAANAKLEKMAATDFLTGLYNRRYFYELSNSEFFRARRYQHPTSMIMLDADNFKMINDTYGHSIGDQVLKNIANLCLQLCRKSDIIGRMGGEELAICCPQTDLVNAVEQAERIRSALETTQVSDGDKGVSVTLSLGVAQLADSDQHIDDMLCRADKLLYQAKRNGRNQVVSELKNC